MPEKLFLEIIFSEIKIQTFYQKPHKTLYFFVHYIYKIFIFKYINNIALSNIILFYFLEIKSKSMYTTVLFI